MLSGRFANVQYLYLLILTLLASFGLGIFIAGIPVAEESIFPTDVINSLLRATDGGLATMLGLGLSRST